MSSTARSAFVTPHVDLDAAAGFLSLLDEDAEGFTLQTFDDTAAKRRDMAQVLHGPLRQRAERLIRLNQHGAGVFVTINETDGKGRQQSNIQRVRALFVDLDGAPLAPVLSAPVGPHLVVESSPRRYHAYWRVTGVSLDQFKALQQALATKFGGDKSVCDTPRVMRLPGFLHHKGEPFQTRVIDAEPGEIGVDAFIAAMALTPSTPTPRAAVNGTAPGGWQAMVMRIVATAAERTHCDPGKARHGQALWIGGELKTAGLRLSDDIVEYAVETFAQVVRSTDLSGNAQFDADNAAQAIRAGYAGTATATPAATRAWREPEPLTVSSVAQPYPLDALPELLAAAVSEVHAYVQAPLPVVAGCALSALATAGQAYADVRRDAGLTGPCSLFLLTVAESGERKSTCDHYFITPIRTYEQRQEAAAVPELKNHRADIAAWEERHAAIRQRIQRAEKAGKPTEVEAQKLRDLQQQEPEPPRIPHLIRGDHTAEALAYGLYKQWPAAGILVSEGGVVLGGHALSEKSAMRSLACYNRLWDGDDLPVDRRTSESFTVRGARLSFGLQVQQETLRAFFNQHGPLARGIGFLARFLFAWPASTQGRRKYREPPSAWPALTALNGRIMALLDNEPLADDNGALTPPLLALDPAARAAWIAFHDEIEAALVDGGELYDVRDVASKIADNAARLACLFHLLQHGASGAIGIDTFEGAARLALWHLFEAQRFFRAMALPPELAAAQTLEAWLLDCHAGVPQSTVDAQRYGPAGTRRKAALDQALNCLEDHHRLQITKDGRRRLIHINPSLLDAVP